ncbi:hypothetical protein AAES_157981 [Amazona aestiva]|uniref:Fibrosin-1-like protein n=1 Tax=Amazona aestiva TaxID=12930 RepID=A0A0Q3PDU3_AMAAE|nr:hypothetical protein AAES_157981 [Amazona aestiva]
MGLDPPAFLEEGDSLALTAKKDMSLKPQERKEKWERHPGKKPRESENCVSAEPSENGHNNDAGSSEREAERGKERMKKKLPLKLSKQIMVNGKSKTWTCIEAACGLEADRSFGDASLRA